jgi:hypothetical protein
MSGLSAEISADPSAYLLLLPIDLTDPFFQKRRIIHRASGLRRRPDRRGARLRAVRDSPQDTELTRAAAAPLDWNSVLDNGVFRWPVSYNYEVTFTSVDTSKRPMQLSTQALPAAGRPRDRTTESTIWTSSRARTCTPSSSS